VLADRPLATKAKTTRERAGGTVAGEEIVRLRPLIQRFGFGTGLANASTALALGDGATAVEGFPREDCSVLQGHVYPSGR
jgi:hypothetical protein